MAKNANKRFLITGRVIDRTTRQGVSGLLVEGWDKDLICDDLVGSAVTKEQGIFAIGFTASYFKELFLDRQPDLFFRQTIGDKTIGDNHDYQTMDETYRLIDTTLNMETVRLGDILLLAAADDFLREAARVDNDRGGMRVLPARVG